VLVRSFINLPRLLAPLAIGMLLIWLGFAAVRITNLIRRRRISPSLRRAIWLAGFFLMAAALAATLLVTTRHVWSPSVRWDAPRPVTPPSGFTYYVFDGFVRLPFMRDELAEMPATAASDQRIAAAIVEASGRLTAAPAADSVLAALGTREAFIASADMRVYGRRFAVLSTTRGPYTRRDDFGPSASISSTDPRIQIDPFGTLILRLPAANIDDSMRVRIDLGALAVVILGLWVVWGAARGVAALALWRLGRRRRANGRCPACGYRLRSHRANTPT
jgi:hypothetical protein